MTPTDYLRAVRRRWSLVLAAVIVAASAGAFAGGGGDTTAEQEHLETYEATVLLLSAGNLGPTRSGGDTLQTVAILATVGEMPQRVKRAAGFRGSTQELLEQVGVQAERETSILKITATSEDPQEAELLGDTYAEELLDFLQERATAQVDRESALLRRQIRQGEEELESLEAQINRASEDDRRRLQSERDTLLVRVGQLQSNLDALLSAPYLGSDLEVIQQASAELAEPDTTGFEPPESRVAWVGIGGLLGLVMGIALALFLERFDTRVRTKEGAEGDFGAPVLAEVPVLSARDRRGVVSPASQAADAFRLLGVALLRGAVRDRDGEGDAAGRRGGAVKVILVTSAGPAEGKTTVAANLAATYAEGGRSVLVISCDLRRPSIHRLLGVDDDSGLAQILYPENGQVPLARAVRETSVPGVELVPSGVPDGTPGRLLSPSGMRQVIEQARRHAEVVILDSPSILTASDISHLLPEVDAVLLVARAGRTTSQVARRAMEILGRLGAPVVGVALNGATESPQPKGGMRYYRSLSPREEAPEHEQDDVPEEPISGEPAPGPAEWR